MSYCSHPVRAVFGPGTAQAQLEGFSFSKCAHCHEETNLAGRVTLPAKVYTDPPVHWSKASMRLGMPGVSFAEAVRRLRQSTEMEEVA